MRHAGGRGAREHPGRVDARGVMPAGPSTPAKTHAMPRDAPRSGSSGWEGSSSSASNTPPGLKLSPTTVTDAPATAGAAEGRSAAERKSSPERVAAGRAVASTTARVSATDRADIRPRPRGAPRQGHLAMVVRSTLDGTLGVQAHLRGLDRTKAPRARAEEYHPPRALVTPRGAVVRAGTGLLPLVRFISLLVFKVDERQPTRRISETTTSAGFAQLLFDDTRWNPSTRATIPCFPHPFPLSLSPLRTQNRRGPDPLVHPGILGLKFSTRRSFGALCASPRLAASPKFTRVSGT